MSMELGFGIAIAGVALLIYADYLKIPRTRINALAWGIPISLVFIGLAVAYTNRGSSRYSWDDPSILRLTSRPIGA